MGNANAENCRNALAEIITTGRYPFEEVFFLAVVVQRTCQCTSKTGHVRSAFDRMDIVDIGLHVFSVFGAVLQCNIVLGSLFFTRNLNHITVQHIACPVEMFNEFNQATFVLEVASLTIAFIMELDVNTTIEECEFL